MEYLIKEQLEKLNNQRSVLVEKISEFNENLPNYQIKVGDLTNQIFNIDNQVKDLIRDYKEIKIIELQNELTIKQLDK